MISRMRKLISSLSILLGTLSASAQNGQIQTPGQIQQPKGPWQKPGNIQSVQSDRCHQRLTVGADALFEFNKVSLADAAQQTLATLGPGTRQESTRRSGHRHLPLGRRRMWRGGGLLSAAPLGGMACLRHPPAGANRMLVRHIQT
jgi:hypothetical protein